MNRRIVLKEMGLRDGLQNESAPFPLEQRLELIRLLVAAGIRFLEVGSFVRPEAVPQMAMTGDLLARLHADAELGKGPLKLSVLVPNLIGFEKALAHKLSEVAFFTAASESFAQKNMNSSIQESFQRLGQFNALAKKNRVKIRGYLSTVFGCPFEGSVDRKVVVELVQELFEAGCYEVSLGDTIGIADPGQVIDLCKLLKRKKVPMHRLAGHFHDTRGMALVNTWAAFEQGIEVFDASIGGLGGCPYAPGATGNVATEEVVRLFHSRKVKTGLKLNELLQASKWLQAQLGPGRSVASRLGRVGLPLAGR